MAELSYFVRKSCCAAVLAASGMDQLATSLEAVVLERHAVPQHCNCTMPEEEEAVLPPARNIDLSDRYQNNNAPGLVVFTSGTTGRPKGVVHRRAIIHEFARLIADYYEITDDDLVLHHLSVHHGAGAYVSFFPFLISGACIEFRSGSFSAPWTWDRWRRGGSPSSAACLPCT